MAELRRESVLITGGAAGIGSNLAKEFAEAGCRVIVTDVNTSALNAVTRKLKSNGGDVSGHTVDVSDREAVKRVIDQVVELYDGLDILINNAGIGYNGELAEMGPDGWARLLNVNFWGVLNSTYAALPSMIERRAGHIVNVSSGQVFFRLPTWGAYTATKLAMAGFSEILGYELRKFKIKVTTVYPFAVNTGFYDGAATETLGAKLSMRLLPFYSQSPDTVARTIFKAIRRGRREEMVHPLNALGFYARFVPMLPALIGTLSDMFLSKNADCVRPAWFEPTGKRRAAGP